MVQAAAQWYYIKTCNLQSNLPADTKNPGMNQNYQHGPRLIH